MTERPPYHEDGFIYFELASGKLAVFEPGNNPAVYEIFGAQPGFYRLPVDAILNPTAREREEVPDKLVPVDRAQIFFVDLEAHQSFLSAFDDSRGSWPNYEYFDVLRAKIGSSFGYLVAGSEPAKHFKGDGTYVIDVAQIDFVPHTSGRRRSLSHHSNFELMVRVARTMNTFVCTVCFQEEFMCYASDPKDSALEAKERGWSVTNERSEFGDFKVYGPNCAPKAGKTSGQV